MARGCSEVRSSLESSKARPDEGVAARFSAGKLRETNPLQHRRMQLWHPEGQQFSPGESPGVFEHASGAGADSLGQQVSTGMA